MDKSYHDLLIEVMKQGEDIQDDPRLGIFWYDINNDELFGVNSSLAQDNKWYSSDVFKTSVRTDSRLHKKIWKKESYRERDTRFSGDYTKIPRGRVFEFKDIGFVVFTGSWIKEYPWVKELIKEEFELPNNTKFKVDSHWEIGHGWSDEKL